MDILPEEWEVILIKRLDNEALTAYAKEAKEAEKRTQQKK
jgi:hypothetical protein